MQFIGLGNCPNCGSDELHRSRVRNIIDALAYLILLRPVRCYQCMRRHFVPIWLRTKQHVVHAEPDDRDQPRAA
jgi:hypothetical protein